MPRPPSTATTWPVAALQRDLLPLALGEGRRLAGRIPPCDPETAMSALEALRIYHAVLAVLVVAAYASGELGLIHAWLGYAIALVVLVRLGWAATGVPHLGLARFYPRFEGLDLSRAATHPAISRLLLLGIAASLIGATATGIALDRGRSIGMAGVSVSPVPQAHAGPRDSRERKGEHGKPGEEHEGPLSEIHEFLANLLVGLVVLHVAYLLTFKRPLARFMLFLDAPRK